MKEVCLSRRQQWRLDIFQLLGALAAVGAGTGQPLMTLVVGGLANEFNRPRDRSTLRKEIDSEVLFFVYIFLGQWCLTCLYGILLSISAMKHSRSLRAKYLNSAIRQEMGLISQGKAIDNLATSISTIEDALAEKLGIIVQAGSTVIVSLIIAFVHSWQLSLALSSTILLLFISNFGTAAIETKAERGIQNSDEEASTLAEECLSAIRLVMSCVAEAKLSGRHTALLQQSRAKRFRKSPILGLQFSISYLGLLCSYGLAFWFGTILLKEGKIESGGIIVMYTTLFI
jgi:ATP-binding cassette subfamily B (MDR/TAP) protein 1